MGWQDAPAVDQGSDKPAWMSAPAVDQPKAAPTKEDVQAALIRRQVAGANPLAGGKMSPDVLMGARQVMDSGAEMLAKLFGDRKTAADTNQAAKDQYEKNYQPESFPGAGFARGAGGAAVLSAATPALAAGGVVKSALQGAGMGAVTAPLTEPAYGVSDEDFWNAKGQQAKEGAATGAVFGAGGALAGKVLNPTIGADQQALVDAKVRQTPGQLAGGLWKSIEDKMTSFPIIGDLIQKQRFNGITDFNKAVYSRAVAPFGDEGAQVVKAADVGNKGIAAVGDYLSSKYEQALAQSAPAPFAGAPAHEAIDNLAGMLPQQTAGEFTRIMQQQVMDKLSPAGTLTPSVAKQADSALGAAARAMAGDGRYEVRELSAAIREAQSTLREAFADANPTTAPLIRAADQGWATLVQMERAGGMAGAGKDGIFTPAQLLSAIKRGDTSIRDRRFARGEMLNQDLAQAGQEVLPSKVPDSGTVGRAMVNSVATGGAHLTGMLNPTTLAAGAAASLPYLPVIGPAMTSLAMLARPQGMRNSGDLLKQLAPYLGLLSASRGP